MSEPVAAVATSTQDKAYAETNRLLLGRVKHSLRVGVVGLPNVGKSTLFTLLTKLEVPAANYAFCTKDPNTARCRVPDPRFDQLCEMYSPAKREPGYLTVVDIAGLVRGASEGRGLGNAFLSHIAAVDAIFHVVRVFDDAEIVHVEETVDPVRDLEIITTELVHKDMQRAQEWLTTNARRLKASDASDLRMTAAVLGRVVACLEAGRAIRFEQWSVAEAAILRPLQFLTAKPVIYLVNMSPRHYSKRSSKWLPRIMEWIAQHGGEPIIPFSAAFETTIVALEGGARDEYVRGLPTRKGGKPKSAIPRIIRAGYQMLSLITMFTCGAPEVHAWTLRRETLAPQAAGAIHTDFERGFIRAEVIACKDLLEAGSEVAARAAGKAGTKGKDYVVQDGDIVHFFHNASKAGRR